MKSAGAKPTTLEAEADFREDTHSAGSSSPCPSAKEHRANRCEVAIPQTVTAEAPAAGHLSLGPARSILSVPQR